MVELRAFDLCRSLSSCCAERLYQLGAGLLYADDGAAETLQICTGLNLPQHINTVFRLQDATVTDAAVYTMLTGQEPKNLIVLTSRLLTDSHPAVLRAIQVHPSVLQVTILSTVSEEAHAAIASTSLGVDAYLEYETAVDEDLAEVWARNGVKREKPTVIVQYFPVQVCPISGHAFVLPSLSSAGLYQQTIAGSLLKGIRSQASHGTASGVKETKAESTILAHSLVGLAAALDCKLETFSLGSLADALGDEICSILPPDDPQSRPPRKTAALVLIDRTQDLQTPAHHAGHILDRVMGVLPRTAIKASASSPAKTRSLDVSVPCTRDGSNGSHSPKDTARERIGHDQSGADSIMASLFPSDAAMNPWLQLLIGKREADALLYLRKWLREAVRKEGLQLPRSRSKPGAVTAADLKALLGVLNESSIAVLKHRSLVTIATAAVLSYEGLVGSQWETIGNEEQRLVDASSGGSEAVTVELCEMLHKSSGNNGLRLQDALLLAIQAFSLLADASQLTAAYGGPMLSEEQLERLRASLQLAVLQAEVGEEDRWLGDLVDRLIRTSSAQGASHGAAVQDRYTDKALQLEIQDKVNDLMERLIVVGTHRQKTVSQLRSPPEMSEEAIGVTMRKLTSSIAKKQSITGMQHHSASLRNMINTGLGRFGLKQKHAMPFDHETVIIFFLGGICMGDIRAMHEALDLLPENGINFMCGGSALVSPNDLLRFL